MKKKEKQINYLVILHYGKPAVLEKKKKRFDGPVVSSFKGRLSPTPGPDDGVDINLFNDNGVRRRRNETRTTAEPAALLVFAVLFFFFFCDLTVHAFV